MSPNPIKADVRPVQSTDLAQIATIKNHYIAHTTRTLKTQPLTTADLQALLASKSAQYLPWLVATSSNSDGKEEEEVLGYAYLSPASTSTPEGYTPTLELAIWLRHDARGAGLGGSLVANIFALLSFRPRETIPGGRPRSVLARMLDDGSSDGAALQRFYERCGFTVVGRVKGAEVKFGKWLDKVYLQRVLS